MSTSKTSLIGAIQTAHRNAPQWRLMLIWLLALLLPTAIAILPFWSSFSEALDHSVHAAELARQLDGIVVLDLMASFVHSSMALRQGGIISMLLLLAMSPFLTGTVITAARASTRLGFSALLQGGLHEYGRLLRMLVWAIVPMGIAFSIGHAGSDWVKHYGEKAILESAVESYQHMATAVLAILLLLAHATLDAGRAQLALYSQRTSAVKAWWRGLKVLRKNASGVLGSYILVTLLGVVLAVTITAVRIALPQLGALWFCIGLVLTQVAVATLVWMRITRLLALIEVSREPQV